MRKLTSIVITLLCLLLSHNLFAYDYDPLLIRAQASIFPKIIMLDKNISLKTNGDSISIAIISSEQDTSTAQQIKNDILNKYKNGLGQKILKVKLISFKQLASTDKATAYYMLKASKKQHRKVTSFAAAKNRIVFSYDYKDFKSNALISVLVKEKTYIYLNKSALHEYNIKFLPLFYKIAKIIE